MNQMLEQQQQTTPDAGRQSDSFDDTLNQAGELGQQRRQSFIEQEQREIAEAKANIESREQAFNRILQRQEEESQRAGRNQQSEAEGRRRTQDDMSQQGQEIGRERRLASENESIDAKIRRRKRKQAEVMADIKENPTKFVKGANAFAGVLVRRGGFVATGAAAGWYGGVGHGLAVAGGTVATAGLSKTLGIFAEKWRAERILKQYDLHFGGTHGLKYAIDAYEAIMNEAIRKGTISTFRTQQLIQRSQPEDDDLRGGGGDTLYFEAAY